MFLKGAIRPGTQGRKAAMFATAMVALLSVPVMMYSFSPNPPLGYTGAPGQGARGCATCHGTLTTPSALTITAPATYTPGSTTPVAMSVSIPSSGGFELQILDSTGASAGMLTQGTGSQVLPFSGTITQDLSNSANGTSWSFTWTPGTATGTVTVYATGGTHNASYLSTATITASGGGGGGTTTLSVSPAGPLSFSATAGGAAPAAQGVMVTAAGGTTNAAFTATPASTGNWLTVGGAAAVASGTTPLSESIGVNPTGLTASATPYTGTVVFACPTCSPTSVTLNVSLTVSSGGGGGGGQTYSLAVVDRQNGGADYLFLEGSGDATNPGSGNFARFRSMTTASGGDRRGTTTTTTTSIVSHGTWKATSATSSTSSKQVMQVQLTATTPGGSTLSTGTLTINTGTSSPNATFSTGSVCFNSVGIGTVNGNAVGTASCSTGTGGGGTPPPTDE